MKDPLQSSSCAVVDEDIIELGFKLQEMDAFGNWHDRRIPWSGFQTYAKSFGGSDDRITLFRMRLVSTSGDFTITRVSARDNTGLTSPSVVGLFTGMILMPGDPIEFQLKGEKTYGQTALLNYKVELLEYGAVIDLDVSLKTN